MKSVKIVTIGGGSSYTPELIEGFIKDMMNYLLENYGLLILKKGNISWKL